MTNYLTTPGGNVTIRIATVDDATFPSGAAPRGLKQTP